MLPPGEAGTACYGTEFEAFVGSLRGPGRSVKGAEGDPYGVYHSERVVVATTFMRSTGVLIKLRITGLVMYSAEKDPVTDRHLVPGPRIARWLNNRRLQSCSEPEQVEISRVYLEFGQCAQPKTEWPRAFGVRRQRGFSNWVAVE